MDALLDNAYLLLGLGALLEGELSVLTGGVLAQQGQLALLAVVAIASVVAWGSDMACFWIGRTRGERLLQRMPRVGARMARLHAWVERHPSGAVLAARFTYGMRIAGPMLLGTSRIGALRYAVVSAVGALAWGSAVAGTGWAVGDAARQAFGGAGAWWLAAVPAAVALVALTAMARRWRQQRRDRGATADRAA